MERMMGIINLDHEHDFLQELTYFRCGAAVPFGGRYRLIDFVLSNMINSQIHDVALFTRYKYRSLMDHLGTGAEWDLDRKRGGLFILPPDWNDPTDISRGDLQHFHNNRDFLYRGGHAQYVLISGSQFIGNVDVQKAFRHHLETEADVTLISKQFEQKEPEHSPCLKLETDEQGWVTDITHDQNNSHVFSGMYIIGKRLLLSLVDECIAYEKSSFFLDGIKRNLDRLHVQSYVFDGYAAIINSVESFYKHNMKLLNPEVYQNLFYGDQLIYTKVKDEPPAEYSPSSSISNSLIANGCKIDGEVENSILFRGVRVEKGAKVKNSIIMQKCKVKEGVHLENVILDKDAAVSTERTLIGGSEQPFVVAKSKTL
ncbi:glucose-1-phosphate adenylyltransferase subunit GlgD [Bacillus sp. FJAT-44742]|uniref:glucose-1-phosphate adenylyltransferase subunit GlgD n=1 Tax=Bacillus sp. FJAT-44742 TaxID=2014005 RepID=UPI000C233E50|nr:glucose-1-phosphate adenylyltransferase subunit GlgD [Bacillus sp. FJAT-44742]